MIHSQLQSNTLLVFIMVCLSANAWSQISIDGTQFTTASTVLYFENGSPQWIAEQALTNLTGEEVIWDAGNFQGTLPSNESYFPVTGTPGVYQIYFNNDIFYPQWLSTHALQINSVDSELPLPIAFDDPFQFFKIDSTGYYITGTAFEVQDFPVVTQYNELERIYKFPVLYGDSNTSQYDYLTTIPLLGAYGQSGQRHTTVDGSGELITPFGSYDVLRLRIERQITDTISLIDFGISQSIDRPLQIDYVWLSPDVPGPLLEISTIGGNVITARMLTDDSMLYTDNVYNGQTGVVVYPNPARDFIDIMNSNSENLQIQIVNLSGQVLYSSFNQPSRIDISDIPPGIYVLTSFDKYLSHSQKLVVLE